MTDELKIEEIQAEVYRVPRPNWEEVTTIVLHDTGGSTVGGVLAHFDTLAKQRRALGYHYLIGRKGEVVRLVDEKNRTSHASGANRGTIGIAFIGGSENEGVINTKQLASLTALIGDIKIRHPIEHILGHRHVRPSPFTKSPKTDPRITDLVIEKIAGKYKLNFDKTGAFTLSQNEDSGKKEAAELLSCLAFPPVSFLNIGCKDILNRFMPIPKNDQIRFFSSPPSKEP